MKNTGSAFASHQEQQTKKIQPARLALLAALLLASVASLGIFSAAQEATRPTAAPITISQLAGPWQIALVGFTGCAQSALLFSGSLNASGQAVGTLVGSSSGCKPGSSTQTFTINTLNANGSGTAGLTCGPSCGWGFNIQVAPNRQVFNLVDMVNSPGDVLAGTGVRQ
jgi:hypothetical protein